MSDLPYFLCALASALLLAVGALGLLWPERLSRSYGVGISGAAGLAYVRATAARDLALGAVFAANVYLQDILVLAVLCAAGVVISLADFLIAYTFAGGLRSEHAAHVVGFIGFAAIGTLLASLLR